MPNLRFRAQFDLNTWLVCEAVELFDIVVPVPGGTTRVVLPPRPVAVGESPYSLMVEDIKSTYDCDKILIDVIMRKDKGTTFPSEDSSVQDIYLDDEHELRPYVMHAISVTNKFSDRLIELIRWRTNQSWLGRGGHMTHHDQHIAFAPESGRGPLIGKPMKIRGTSPVGLLIPGEDFKLLGESEWRQVAQDLHNETAPDLHDRLLLDAHYFLFEGNVRRCALEAAIACEIFARKRIRTLTTDPEDSVLKEVLRPGSFVERYLHLGPQYLKQRSLKREDSDLWRRIQELFRARNNAAHQEEWEGMGQDKGRSYLSTARETVAWLESL